MYYSLCQDFFFKLCTQAHIERQRKTAAVFSYAHKRPGKTVTGQARQHWLSAETQHQTGRTIDCVPAGLRNCPPHPPPEAGGRGFSEVRAVLAAEGYHNM